jgi:hypothetical protein
MSTTTEAPASPDLSSLTPSERLNAAVALTQGARWSVTQEPEIARIWEVDRGNGVCWELLWPDGTLFMWTYSGSWFCATGQEYHDYAGDPAAWGALMEKEGVWADPVFADAEVIEGWLGYFRKQGHDWHWSMVNSVGLAIATAVLSKHGIDPTPLYRRRYVIRERLSALLGDKGVERLNQFLSYHDGWDFGGVGKAVDPRSVDTLETFMRYADTSSIRRPSIFLSRVGELILAWDTPEGERVEVDFSPDTMRVFRECDDAEREFTYPAQLEQAIDAATTPTPSHYIGE